MKKIICLLTTVLMTSFVWSQSHYSTQPHLKSITNIISSNTSNVDNFFFTGSEDGFLIKWTTDGQGEHYQISDVGLKLIAVSPNGNDIAVYESDGGSVNKVSVWDWKTLTRKYQRKFTDSVTSLAFSAKGSYLIIGTATVDGAVFVRTSTWQVVNKIKENTSIINYAATSDTEKTCVFYSPAGNLSYYNMQTGTLKQKFSVIQGLSQTVMFNNNIFLAGVKDNTIYIINAFKGTTVSTINAQNPIILSNSKDYNLYYMEYDGKNNYDIKMLENNSETLTVSNPRIVKTLKGPRGNAAICYAAKDFTNFYFGSLSGEVYIADTDPTVTTENMAEITENIYSQILDIDGVDSDFYFLTDKYIYNTSYDTGIITEVFSSNDQTQINSYGDNKFILWSKGSKNPIQLVDIDKKTSETLFEPKNIVQNLKICKLNDTIYLVEIESNSIVNIFDMSSKTLKQVYSGTGVQDAVITNDGNLYVAKSAASNPQVPLICVNIQTQETVPLSVKGNVAYALSTDGNIIYGINLISDADGINTYVFSYNTSTKLVTNILKFANEDSEAFTYLNGNNLFTNIGKNKIYCYNLSTKKRFSYNRSASIPKSICQRGNRVVILNNNGSISWCNPTSSNLMAEWYLTNDNQWVEF